MAAAASAGRAGPAYCGCGRIGVCMHLDTAPSFQPHMQLVSLNLIDAATHPFGGCIPCPSTAGALCLVAVEARGRYACTSSRQVSRRMRLSGHVIGTYHTRALAHIARSQGMHKGRSHACINQARCPSLWLQVATDHVQYVTHAWHAHATRARTLGCAEAQVRASSHVGDTQSVGGAAVRLQVVNPDVDVPVALDCFGLRTMRG